MIRVVPPVRLIRLYVIVRLWLIELNEMSATMEVCETRQAVKVQTSELYGSWKTMAATANGQVDEVSVATTLAMDGNDVECNAMLLSQSSISQSCRLLHTL